jgi:aryl-alcohol dehydrogenase-like predicted oxidoreductase
MDLRPLGATGTAVSAYALGTMTFGAEADEAASHAMLDRYLEAGGNFVDTADVYSHGASEEIIGRWLTGKYSRDERPFGATRLGEDPDRGQEAWDRRNTERTWAVVDAVREIADAHGASMAQVALAWVTGRPGVTSTILGTRTVEQLDDNLGAARLELDPEQVARLEEVSDPGLPPYAYGFIAEMSENRAELSG